MFSWKFHRYCWRQQWWVTPNVCSRSKNTKKMKQIIIISSEIRLCITCDRHQHIQLIAFPFHFQHRTQANVRANTKMWSPSIVVALSQSNFRHAPAGSSNRSKMDRCSKTWISPMTIGSNMTRKITCLSVFMISNRNLSNWKNRFQNHLMWPIKCLYLWEKKKRQTHIKF